VTIAPSGYLYNRFRVDISLAAAAGLGLYDLIDAPRAARRANERKGSVLGLAPLAPDRNGRPTLGLALSRSF
jgi:hypothetical protein